MLYSMSRLMLSVFRSWVVMAAVPPLSSRPRPRCRWRACADEVDHLAWGSSARVTPGGRRRDVIQVGATRAVGSGRGAGRLDVRAVTLSNAMPATVEGQQFRDAGDVVDVVVRDDGVAMAGMPSVVRSAATFVPPREARRPPATSCRWARRSASRRRCRRRRNKCAPAGRRPVRGDVARAEIEPGRQAPLYFSSWCPSGAI